MTGLPDSDPGRRVVSLPDVAHRLGLTRQRRLLVEMVFAGADPVEAYYLAGGQGAEAHARSYVCTTLRQKPCREYEQALAERANSEALWERERLQRWLIEVITTPVGEIGPDHPLAQEYRVGKDGSTTVKMPGKMAAAELLSRISGFLVHEQKIDVHLFAQAKDELRAIRAGEPLVVDAEVVEDA